MVGHGPSHNGKTCSGGKQPLGALYNAKGYIKCSAHTAHSCKQANLAHDNRRTNFLFKVRVSSSYEAVVIIIATVFTRNFTLEEMICGQIWGRILQCTVVPFDSKCLWKS